MPADKLIILAKGLSSFACQLVLVYVHTQGDVKEQKPVSFGWSVSLK